MGHDELRSRAALTIQSVITVCLTLAVVDPAREFAPPVVLVACALVVGLWPILTRGFPASRWWCALGSALWLAALAGGVPVEDSAQTWAAVGLGALASLVTASSYLTLPRRVARLLPPWLPGALLLAWTAVGEFAAQLAMAPHTVVAMPSADFGPRAAEDVEFVATDGVHTRGWLVTADRRRCVILLAGIRGDRRTNIDRAKWWLARDWSVLLLDLRGTGVSDPAPITFGWNERLDLLAAWDALVTRGFESLAVQATSLGAAAFVYAVRDGLAPHPSFAVLEELYGDARSALSARLPFVPWPALALAPLVWSVEHRLGVEADRLRPIDALESLHAPALIFQGRNDHKLGDESGEQLLRAAAVRPKFKQLVWFEDLGHVDLWRHAQVRCEESILAFLERLPSFVPR